MIINFLQGYTIANSNETEFEFDLTGAVDQTTVVIIHDGSGVPTFSGADYYTKTGQYENGETNFIYLSYLSEINGVVINIHPYTFVEDEGQIDPPPNNGDYGVLDLEHNGHYSALIGVSQYEPLMYTKSDYTVFSFQGNKANSRKPIICQYNHLTGQIEKAYLPANPNGDYHTLSSVLYLNDGNILAVVNAYHNSRLDVYRTSTPYDITTFSKVGEIANRNPAYPNVALMSDNTLKMVFRASHEQVYYTKSTDNGTTWSDPKSLIKNPAGYWCYLRLCYSPDKLRFHVNIYDQNVQAYTSGHYLELEADEKTLTAKNGYSFFTGVYEYVDLTVNSNYEVFQNGKSSAIWLDETGTIRIHKDDTIYHYDNGWQTTTLSHPEYSQIKIVGKSRAMYEGSGQTTLLAYGVHNQSGGQNIKISTSNHFQTYTIEPIGTADITRPVTPHNLQDDLKKIAAYQKEGTYVSGSTSDPDEGWADAYVINNF